MLLSGFQQRTLCIVYRSFFSLVTPDQDELQCIIRHSVQQLPHQFRKLPPQLNILAGAPINESVN